MRSRFDLTWLLAVFAVLAPLPCPAQPDSEPASRALDRAEVQKALDKVANDPNLAPEQTVNMLRWVETERDADVNGLVRWLQGLFEWLAESGRYLVWVIGAFLAVLLVMYLVRLVQRRGPPRVPQPLAAPSHVRDLDIRPESLPGDVGAAALALWQRGEERAALALLYRGLLSRLVHAHGVPIRASSTEGECLALARPRLRPPGAEFASRLIGIWAAAVYGASPPAGDAVSALCTEFASALDGPGAAA